MQNISLKITGMTCASCAKLNKNAIVDVNGVKSADVDISTNKAVVEFDEKTTNVKEIVSAIENAGYGVEE